VKVTGHQKSSNKDHIDRLFSLVDKASRRALREEVNSCPPQS
jgi:ribonuclease HI